MRPRRQVGNLEEFLGLSGGAETAAGATAAPPSDEVHVQHPLLKKFCPLGWRERLAVLTDAVRGLHFLHRPSGAKGVVLHRDVKPPNILIDERLTAKLSDFGLGKIATALTQGHTHLSSKSIIGTFGYIDPLYSDSGR